MQYLLSKRYKGKTMTAKEVNLPAMTVAEEINNVIKINSQPICYATSQVGHEYFARNDDGFGMERGQLTYAIAFSDRERYNADHTRRQRFTDKEIELLESKWNQFLIPDIDVILFNHDFFNADIFSLREMAKDLNITVKE